MTDEAIMTDMSNMLRTTLQIEAVQLTPTTGESLLSHIVSQYTTTRPMSYKYNQTTVSKVIHL